MAADKCQQQSFRFQQAYNPLKLRRNPCHLLVCLEFEKDWLGNLDSNQD